MFVLPDPPPDRYALRPVKPNILSAQEFTPYADPRVTQPNIAKFLQPLPNADGEYVIAKVPDPILDRWTDRHRENWVAKPGVNAAFMETMRIKYTAPMPEVDPRYMNKPSNFPRSYKYELDCYETRRLRKLRDKMDAEERAAAESCECAAPLLVSPGGGAGVTGRWQEPPKLFAKSQTDPCIRRAEFAKYGQPFKNEACNFYYEHYPAPYVPFHPKKFS